MKSPEIFSPGDKGAAEARKNVRVVVEQRSAEEVLQEIKVGLIVSEDVDADEYFEDPVVPDTPKRGYEVFDPLAEFRSLKTLAPEERALSAEERRDIIKKRIENFKERLLLQREGIKTVMESLRKEIDTHGDVNTEALMRVVQEGASQYGFTEPQITDFEDGIRKCEAIQRDLLQCEGRYPNGTVLYEAYVGKRPEGDVHVIYGTLNMHVQCALQSDYVRAYYGYLTDEQFAGLSKEEMVLAQQSAGFAPRGGASASLEQRGVPGYLAELVTFEDTSATDNLDFVVFNKTALCHQDAISLPLESLLKEIVIKEVGGIHEWILEFRASRDGDLWEIIVRNILDGEFSHATSVMRVPRISPDMPSQKEYLYAEAHTEPQRELHIDLTTSGGMHGQVTLSSDTVKITDVSSRGSSITYHEIGVAVRQGSEQSVRSKIVQTHEEQHKMEEFFSDVMKYRHSVRATDVLAHAKSVEDATERLLRFYGRLYRESNMDRYARSEIISYYKDGRSVDKIKEILLGSPLYDYRSRFAEEIDGVPLKIESVLKDTFSIVEYEDDEVVGAPIPVSAKPIVMDRQEIARRMEEYFVEGYTRDLSEWLRAVSTLEEKGYERDEIVALLIIEPAHSWNRLARRVGKKEQISAP